MASRKNCLADWNLLRVASVGCKPNPSQVTDSDQNYCERSNFIALQKIKQLKPEVVVLAQSTAWQTSEIDVLERALKI